MKKKIIAIVGGGISGLMAAYKILRSAPSKDVEVVMFEKGKHIKQRICPIILKQTNFCINCNHCSIMEGLGGAGAFSDGKYNITTEFGGWLQDLMDPQRLLEYMNTAFKILNEYSPENIKIHKPNNELKKFCLEKNLYMLQSDCIHFGTDLNYSIMSSLIADLERHKNFKLYTETTVTNISEDKTLFFVNKNLEHNTLAADSVILALGRSGSSFFVNWCKEQNIPLHNNQVDLGIRLELPAPIWEDFEREIYEPKIVYRTSKYKDLTRMFCFNGHGSVVMENTDGILTVNGHAYNNLSKKTPNTNFAILSTIKFTEPFDNPIEFLQSIAKLGNTMAGGNSVVVQRFGDLISGQRTTEHRLGQSKVKPTLTAAVPADLSTFIPKRYLDNIIEMIYKLNEIAPGTANYDNLLYGLECKYYSARPETYDNFELKSIENVYTIGDGCGFTRSLAQAAAQGLMVAENILQKDF